MPYLKNNVTAIKLFLGRIKIKKAYTTIYQTITYKKKIDIYK